MPQVFIPPGLQALTGGVDAVELSARTVREVIQELEDRFPGMRAGLCEADGLKPGLVVAIDGNISARGLLSRVDTAAEIHFLPAIGGG